MDMSNDEARQMEFTAHWLKALPAVSSYLHSVVPDKHGVEDMIQEIALGLFRRYETFDQSRSFTGWAIGAARNKILERWRSL